MTPRRSSSRHEHFSLKKGRKLAKKDANRLIANWRHIEREMTMTDFLEHWTNESSENAKLVAQERLIAEVTESIWEAMVHAGVTKSELASRMGATKGYVSQVLKGSRNMTLRTLSDICFALGGKPILRVEGDTHRSASTPTG